MLAFGGAIVYTLKNTARIQRNYPIYTSDYLRVILVRYIYIKYVVSSHHHRASFALDLKRSDGMK